MPRHFDIIDVPQRSAEWLAARAGKLTGSTAGDAVSQPKATSAISRELGDTVKETEKRRTLRNKLAVERICGKSFDQPFRTKWTDDGLTREPFALAEFERIYDECVFTVGFLAHTSLQAGYSPDGYLGDFDAIIDAKCFGWKEHLEALRAETLDADIQAQLFHGMWLTGAKRGHVVFFNPEFPASHRTRIITLDTSDKETKQRFGVYTGRAEVFLEDVDKTVDYLRSFGVAQKVEGAA